MRARVSPFALLACVAAPPAPFKPGQPVRDTLAPAERTAHRETPDYGEAAHAIGDHHRKTEPRMADPLTEVVFVAEAIDLAQDNASPLDWEAIWREGGIGVDRSAVEERSAKREG